MQQRVDERAMVASVVRRAGAGVDRHAGWLVDHGEMLVLIEDGERYLLREGVERWRMRRALNFDGLAALELQFRLGRLSADSYLAMLDEHLHARAADVGDRLREVLVEPHAGGL